MVTIKLTVNNKFSPKYSKLEISGHARFSKKGSDIVCSAISFMVQSVSSYCLKRDILIEKREQNKINIDLEKLYHFSNQLYDYLIHSLFLIYENYSDYIKIIE